MAEEHVKTKLFSFICLTGRIYYSRRCPVPAHLLRYNVTVTIIPQSCDMIVITGRSRRHDEQMIESKTDPKLGERATYR